MIANGHFGKISIFVIAIIKAIYVMKAMKELIQYDNCQLIIHQCKRYGITV